MKIRLVISIDASLAIAEVKEINFEIGKAVLAVDVTGFNPVKKSGITVKEIKKEITAAAKVASVDSSGAYTYTEGLSSYIKPLTVTVRETLGTEALTDEIVLKKGNDYSVDITAELADEYKANYELKQCSVIDLKITELKKTTLTIINNLISQETDITRTYTGDPVTEPTATGDAAEISVEVTVDGETDEATGEDKVLPVDYANLTKTWFDANGNQLESAPVNAGAYYLEIKYTDADGIYAESSAKVKVIVEPVKVILKPSLSVTEYFAGMSAQDVTVNATYTLETTDGKKYNFNPETFWGVSYNNPDVPQSYAPVFKLQKGQTEIKEDGTTETIWTDVTGVIEDASGIKKMEATEATEEKEVTISYRLVFKGTKALFIDGVATGELDADTAEANSAEKNYVVDTTVEVIEANAVNVTINANANAVIDVSAASLIIRRRILITRFTRFREMI